jgi:hypothetical protein
MRGIGTSVDLGAIGVHYVEGELAPEAATETLAVATGIVNIWHAEAQAVADTYHRLEAAFPGRFLLGIGARHRALGTDFRSRIRRWSTTWTCWTSVAC